MLYIDITSTMITHTVIHRNRDRGGIASPTWYWYLVLVPGSVRYRGTYIILNNK